MDRAILNDIHDFWFGALAGPEDYPKEKSGLWFKQSDETDDHIRKTYGAYVDEAARADWDLDALKREMRHALRERRRADHALDAQVGQVCDLIRALTCAALLVTGHHTHKGQWRKKRYG